MDGQTDRQTDEETDRQTGKQITSSATNALTYEVLNGNFCLFYGGMVYSLGFFVYETVEFKGDKFRPPPPPSTHTHTSLAVFSNQFKPPHGNNYALKSMAIYMP